VREPFVAVRNIDFSIAWRELFRGKIVSDIYVDEGQMTFVKAATEEASQTDADRRWQAVIKDIFPIDITHFELTDGAIRYQDMTKTPHVDVFVKNLKVVATGLRNRAGEGARKTEEFPAEITMTGETLGGGKLSAIIEAEPLAEQPHFHISAKVDGVNLPDLNESLRAIANVDVGKGTFQMAAEMAGKDGGFQGYVRLCEAVLRGSRFQEFRRPEQRTWFPVMGEDCLGARLAREKQTARSTSYEDTLRG
jgi:hypothetical protein